MKQTVSLIPDAHLLMDSLRSVGYRVEYAVADIIDNSIAAGATIINLIFRWDGCNSQIFIIDNGLGMQRKELIASMKIGSADPTAMRSENDLGRFGMGMKTAAFSMGKKLTVISKVDSGCASACWDLEYIRQQAKGEWELIVDEKYSFDSLLDKFKHGTCVVIEKLDRIVSGDQLKDKTSFSRQIEQIDKHLSLVFHRFLTEDQLKITIGMDLINTGDDIVPWDPFVRSNRATQELADEKYSVDNRTVTIQPYVLPHKTKFTSEEEYNDAGGPSGWDQQQGFYLYRNRRLIMYGTWFRIFRREPAYNLARICVDITSGFDFDWKIDIKKSLAVPPLYMKDLLEKTATLCAERSARVYNSRGARAQGTTSQNLDFVWEQRRSPSGHYRFYINKKHPLLMSLKSQLDTEEVKLLNSYLLLVENFPPFLQSGVADQFVTYNGTPSSESISAEDMALLQELKEFIEKFRTAGYSDDEIRATVMRMPNYRSLKKHISEMLVEAAQ